MDYSTRQRYRSRRNSLERRRRVALLALCLIALLSVGVGLLVQRVVVLPPAVHPVPTVVGHADALKVSATARSTTPALPTTVPRQEVPPPPTVVASAAEPFFDLQRLAYEPNFYAPQIQAFLNTQPGPLKGLTFQVGDRQHSFAEVLSGQMIYSSVNPKVILALLEMQSGLLSTANPPADRLDWAMGYHGENGNRRGLRAQVRWARSMMTISRRDYPNLAPLTYADQSSSPPPSDMDLGEYIIARVLAPTTTPDHLPELLQKFLQTYIALFGDSRQAPTDWPAPAQPFLVRPMEHVAPITSFFDHDAPFLGRNGSIVTYWGRAETQIYYDGHDGWDYGLAPPEMALAAAEGDVVFAGNADDNCETRAVVIDHNNGYRTLYWHLSQIDVTMGQHVVARQPVGMVGSSGCALGPHLHLGVQYLGRAVDPYGWCGGATPDPWKQNPFGNTSTWLWADRPSPCAAPPAGAVVVDNDSPGFSKSGDGWQTVPIGYGGSALYIPSIRGSDNSQPWDLRSVEEPSVALYKPHLPTAGRYRVLAYIPYFVNGLDDATHIRYRVRYSGGEAEVVASAQVYANDWVDLGTYDFTPDSDPLVSVSNLVEDNGLGVWADAVMWLPTP